MLHKISVQCPVLNEVFWIKAFVKNVSRFAHEIIFMDMGSTDGTVELIEKLKVENKLINLYQWSRLNWIDSKKEYEPYVWEEGKVRNFMLDRTSCDWIMPIAPDELYGNDFIQFVKLLHQAQWGICRLLNYTFWQNAEHIRVGSLWPPFNIFHLRGKRYFKWFRNYRGLYPSRRVTLIRNSKFIRFEDGGNHSNISYKGRNPRYNNLIPGLVYDPPGLGFFHYHFLGPVKVNENRGDERDKPVKLIPFAGKHPKEMKLLDFKMKG